MKRIFRFLGVAFFVLLILSSIAIWNFAFRTPTVNLLALPPDLIDLNTPTGKELLSKSSFNTDYMALSSNFESQSRSAYCGVASSVIVLNALHGTQRKISQDTFFDEAASRVRGSLQVTLGGMTLANLGDLLRSHGVTVELFYASDSSIDAFRSIAQQNLKTAGDYLLINYQRAGLGQKETGHISPVAAYNAETDRFLVLDVASYKYPPVWVSTSVLWAAMNTLDSDSGRTRGFVIVRDGAH